MACDEFVIGTNDHGVLNEMTVHLVLLLDGVLLVGIGISGTILLAYLLRVGTLILEESLQRSPRLVVEEVLLAQRVDDDMERHQPVALPYHRQRVNLRLAPEPSEDAVAGKHKVLWSKSPRAVALCLQQRAELGETRAPHEGRVGDGEQQGHRRVARVAGVLVETHLLQVGLVAERLAAEGHRAVRRVPALLLSSVDDGLRRSVVHLLHIRVVHQVLLGCGDDVATSHEPHLVDVRENVLAHTLPQQLGVVAVVAPAARSNQRGRVGHHGSRSGRCQNVDIVRTRGGSGLRSLHGRPAGNLLQVCLVGKLRNALSRHHSPGYSLQPHLQRPEQGSILLGSAIGDEVLQCRHASLGEHLALRVYHASLHEGIEIVGPHPREDTVFQSLQPWQLVQHTEYHVV